MIYVVRHGQTEWNSEGRLQGRNGLPLNEVGNVQANKLREALKKIKFDIVYSSPQTRAVQTAEIITGMQAKVDTRLDVFDLGEADGLLRSEVHFLQNIPDPQQYKGVEDVKQFVTRIFNFMDELKDEENTANILISGHRCTTGCIGAYFNGIPKDGNILKYSSANGEYKTYTRNV